MNRFFYFLLLLCFTSCQSKNTLLGDWEARHSSENYAEFAVYDNFIHIYTETAGTLSSWEYSIAGDSLRTPS